MNTSLWWRLIRHGFHLLYYEFAWTYDLVSWMVSIGHWRQWQRAGIRHLTPTDSSLILELAHGTGNLQTDLIETGWLPVGLDLSPFMSRIASRKLRSRHMTPRLLRGNAMRLPFSDGAFDNIISTFPTEFIMQSETVAEMFRVLKPKGRVVMVLNGMLTIANPFVWFLEWLYRITGQRNPWPADSLDGFKRAGFAHNTQVDNLQGSKIWMLIAEKR